MTTNINDVTNFIWSVADLLRDHYLRGKYADVILPFTVLKRLDCVLEPTKDKVLKEYEQYGKTLKDPSGLLKKASGFQFYNISNYNFDKLLDDPNNIKINIIDYVNKFSPNVGEIVDKFKLREQINNLDELGLLYKVVQRFAEIEELHPDKLSNHDMGYVFEDLIRRFNEQSNENPGEHFTPREIIRLMVNLLMIKDEKELSPAGKIVTVYDPACGTGGMLTIAKEHILNDINPQAEVKLFGQEVNAETFAVCKSDMFIKGEDADNIKYGSSFSKDGLNGYYFDYILSNPPYGKDWKQDKEFILDEYERGSGGRFFAGLPRINDGQLLFLQHMISKMHSKDSEPTRIAVVFDGAPLFSGEAGSGESEIRRWIIENDWLEAIIGLPNQLFYNTGINTFIWIMTNQKEKSKKGKISLINAVDIYQKRHKSLGDKRNELSDEQINEITNLYLQNTENKFVKIFPIEEFGYRRVTIDRPLRMNFQASSERIDKLNKQKSFQNLAISKNKNKNLRKKEIAEGEKEQKNIIKALREIDNSVYADWVKFETIIDDKMKKYGLKLSSSIKNAIRNSLGERDSEAAIIQKNKKGDPLPDPELRDYEDIPLKKDIYEYFENEVIPHMQNAWMSSEKTHIDGKDGKIGKIGYEINFNKYFYTFKAPRKLDIIDSEITELNSAISKLLDEVKQ